MPPARAATYSEALGRDNAVTRRRAAGGAALALLVVLFFAALAGPIDRAGAATKPQRSSSCARAAATASVASLFDYTRRQLQARTRRAFVRATLCAINRVRARRGLRPLRLSRRLSRAAAAHSRDMVRRGYFSHTAPGGLTFLARIVRSGYLRGAHSWIVGENIAWGMSSLATPAATLRMWMNSPPHRANLLSPRFREAGIGIATGVPGRPSAPGVTYTVDFGRKR